MRLIILKFGLTSIVCFLGVLASATSAPSLLYPASGAINIPGGALARWQPVGGTSAYIIEFDTSATFNSAAFRQKTVNASSTNVPMDNLHWGAKYYWRLRSVTPVDTSAYSSTWNFDVTSNGPAQSAPANNAANIAAGTTLNWNAHYYITRYMFECDTVAGFNSPGKIAGIVIYSDTVNNGSDSEIDLGNLYYGKTHYWRVRSENSTGFSNWTGSRSFNVSSSGPSATAPADGASNIKASVTIDWNAHNFVQSYDYQLDTTPTFNSPIMMQGIKTYIDNTHNNGDTKSTLDNLYYGKTYYWRVRSRNNTGVSDWTLRTFIVESTVRLASPAAGATDIQGAPVMDWDAHLNIVGYNYRFDTVPSFNSGYGGMGTNWYATSGNGGSDTKYQINNFYYGKTYYWQVRSFHTKDTSAWTPLRTFTVTQTGPKQLSPANGTLNIPVSSVLLDWYAHNKVNSYLLEVDVTNQFNSASLVIYSKNYISSGNGGSDTEQAIGPLQSNTIYYWRLKAICQADTSDWSPVWGFSTGSTPFIMPTAPILVSPSNNATNQPRTILLNWNGVTGINNYEFEADLSPSFNTAWLVSGTKSNIAGNDNDPDTEHLLTGLGYNETIYWRVRTSTSASASTWSNTWSFVTEIAFVPAAPALVSPANNSSNISWNALLDWNAVSGATTYEYQVDSTLAFTSPWLMSGSHAAINTQSNNNDTQLQLSNLAAGTNYFWRVRATIADTTSAWSNTWKFTTEVTPTSIKDASANVQLDVHPNPVSAHAQITVGIPQTKIENIYIVDMRGQTTMMSTPTQSMSSSSTTLDVSRFPAGAYLLHIVTSEGLKSCKILKQ